MDGVLGQPVRYVWHKESDLSGLDCVILPGGFSYGDYLRPGAIARFSPVMDAVKRFAADGGAVLGICNGFQILCEAGLLPGASCPTPASSSGASGCICAPREPILRSPGALAGAGVASPNLTARATTSRTTRRSPRWSRRVAWPSATATRTGAVTDDANPNGSLGNIAGIVNERGNVLGMMPHPERCCEALSGRRGRQAAVRVPHRARTRRPIRQRPCRRRTSPSGP